MAKEYFNGLIAYVDFIGFQELIKLKSAGEIYEILTLPGECSSKHGLSEDDGIYNTFWFSDLYIRMVNIDRHKELSGRDFLFFEIIALVDFQIESFRKYNILMRGSVNIGNLFADFNKKIFYGHAFVDAYNNEHSRSKFPRVIIDESVINFYTDPPSWYGNIKQQEKMNPRNLRLKDIISKDDDGIFFIDYLGYYIRNSACESGSGESDDFLVRHKEFIEDRLKSKDYIEKYFWLKDYHNKTILSHRDYLKGDDIRGMNFLVS